jgi:hypothetical protein
MHVGHNWWRWREISQHLLPAIARVRDDLGKISFVGMWWDAPPPWAAAIGQEPAFTVDVSRFRELRIDTQTALPYRDVIATMSTARINVMTQRPLLRWLRLVTSKYFELFTADTIPLMMLDPDHAEQVYGPEARELTLHEEIDRKLIDVVRNPQRYREVVQAVREHLAVHHSYDRRLQDLLTMLRGTPPVEEKKAGPCHPHGLHQMPRS